MTTTVAAGLLVVRLAVGLTMLAAHGYAKIFRGGRLAGTAQVVRVDRHATGQAARTPRRAD